MKLRIMPGIPFRQNATNEPERGSPGFVSTRFRPFLIFSLRHADVRKMRGGLRGHTAFSYT